MLGAGVLALYVPIAIGLHKIPFAASTEYESRRKFAEKRLGVKIPRTGDKMKRGGRLGSAQIDLPDDSDESTRVAVGRAYSLGDAYLDDLCSASQFTGEVKRKISSARVYLLPPSGTFLPYQHRQNCLTDRKGLERPHQTARPRQLADLLLADPRRPRQAQDPAPATWSGTSSTCSRPSTCTSPAAGRSSGSGTTGSWTSSRSATGSASCGTRRPPSRSPSGPGTAGSPTTWL